MLGQDPGQLPAGDRRECGEAGPHDLLLQAECGETTAIAYGCSRSSVWTFVGEHLRHLPSSRTPAASVRAVRERQPGPHLPPRGLLLRQRRLAGPDDGRRVLRRSGIALQRARRDVLPARPGRDLRAQEAAPSRPSLTPSCSSLTRSPPSPGCASSSSASRSPWPNIQPEYLKEIATAGERPDQLPDLRELLEQNFIQESAGSLGSPRPTQGRAPRATPQPRPAAYLRHLRGRAADRSRRFRGEAAVLAGFKKAWADSDYDTIVKVGARLPQDYLVELPAVLAYVRNARSRLSR